MIDLMSGLDKTVTVLDYKTIGSVPTYGAGVRVNEKKHVLILLK